MSIYEYLLILISWNIFGMIALGFIVGKSEIIGNCTSSDFFNPLWLYSKYKVNWFGASIMCIFLNLLCPIWSIGFWFYKLCTVGRK